ncbi:MAG: hypothetical protein RLZZ628_1225 [Bacteroidota bacterium]|jgi:hypothetical protein
MEYPFIFNRFKHHLGAVRAALREETPAQIENNLKQIGDSVMDLYTGDLSAEQLFEAIANQLMALNIYESTLYESFLKANDNYYKLTVSDGSEWILLMGNDLKHFVHIHPARYADHSIRVKASNWKTVILAKVRPDANTTIDLQAMNQIRKKLALSPLKSIASASALMRLWELL